MDDFQIRNGLMALYASDCYTYLRVLGIVIEWKESIESVLTISSFDGQDYKLFIGWGSLWQPFLGVTLRTRFGDSNTYSLHISPLEWFYRD